MATLRALRLLQSIESKNINSSQLETLLAGNASRQTDLPLLFGQRAAAARILATETFPTILESSAATTGLANSTLAMTKIAASVSAMGMVASSATGSTAIASNDIGAGLVLANRTVFRDTIGAASTAILAPWAKQWRYPRMPKADALSFSYGAISSTGVIYLVGNGASSVPLHISQNGGESWSTLNAGGPTNYSSNLSFAGGYFFALTTNTVQSSAVGGYFGLAGGFSSAFNWSRVANVGIYYAVIATGNNNAAAVTTNPTSNTTWSGGTLPVTQAWADLAASSTTFLAVGGSTNVAATSPNGTSWTQRTLPSNNNWSSIAAGSGSDDGKFMVVGGSAAGAYSTDHGVSWSAITLPSGQNWSRIVYHPNTKAWIAFSASSPLAAVSMDNGATWTTRATPAAFGGYPRGSIGAGGPYVLVLGIGSSSFYMNF